MGRSNAGVYDTDDDCVVARLVGERLRCPDRGPGRPHFAVLDQLGGCERTPRYLEGRRGHVIRTCPLNRADGRECIDKLTNRCCALGADEERACETAYLL